MATTTIPMMQKSIRQTFQTLDLTAQEEQKVRVGKGYLWYHTFVRLFIPIQSHNNNFESWLHM